MQLQFRPSSSHGSSRGTDGDECKRPGEWHTGAERNVNSGGASLGTYISMTSIEIWTRIKQRCERIGNRGVERRREEQKSRRADEEAVGVKGARTHGFRSPPNPSTFPPSLLAYSLHCIFGLKSGKLAALQFAPDWAAHLRPSRAPASQLAPHSAPLRRAMESASTSYC